MKSIFNTDGRYKDLGLLIIRIGLGLSYIIIHGGPKLIGGTERWAKLGGALENFGITFFPAFWGFMAMFAEFFGGICLLLGLFFRPMLTMICFTMVIASSQSLFNGDTLAKIAYPLELMIVLVGLIFIGAGKYSLDKLIFKNKDNVFH